MSNDSISGGAGNDTIFGGIGDDTILGGLGADLMDGGPGRDRLSYADATSRVVIDMLNGATAGLFAAGDVFTNFEDLEGGSDGDLLLGDAGDNLILGGAGDDELGGRFGEDTLEGGAGADTLDGGGNIDTASYRLSAQPVTVQLFSGVATGGDAEGDVLIKIDNLIGSAGGDVLAGNFSSNKIEGGAGADTLNGGSGVDTLSYRSDVMGVTVSLADQTASGGDATGDSFTAFENIEGGAGGDSLTGDAGNNVLWGMEGADTLVGGEGIDTLEGGAGADVLIGSSGLLLAGPNFASYSGSSAAVTVTLTTTGGTGSGGDAAGDSYADISGLIGSAFGDVLTGHALDNVIEGGAGADTLEGGDGIDTLSYAGSNTRVVVDLLNGNTFLGHAEGDVISGFENLTGSRLPDYLLGTNDANVLSGGRGVDRLDGRGGDDTLIGGAQDDNLKGGAGADVFVLNTGDGFDRITDWQDGLDRLDLSDFALVWSAVEAASTDLPIGAVRIDLGDGDGFQINGFSLADFDEGDVIL